MLLMMDHSFISGFRYYIRLFQECDGCENSLLFRFDGDDTTTCDSYIAENPVKKCRKKTVWHRKES